MYLELVRPRVQLTDMVGWRDGLWADLGEKMSTIGGLLMLEERVAGCSRTQNPTVCACKLLWACEFVRELGYLSCPVDGRRVCLHWHGNALGTWAIEAR